MRAPTIRPAAALLGLTLLAGCAAPGGTQATKAERVELDNRYSVDPQIVWSRFRQGNIETWTVDGPALQALHFVKGIKEGEPLEGSARAEEPRPVFRPDMTPNEIMEFTLDSLAGAGLAQLQAHDLRPANFGRLPGFRFKLDFLYRDGLEGRGLVAGAIIGQRLQLILYLGTREHYYGKHLEDVERIVRSIEVGE